MKIDSLSMSDQLRMMKGVQGVAKDPMSVKGLNKSEKGQGMSFGELFAEQIGNVNDLSLKAESAIADQITGKAQNSHSTLIAVQKADISFRLLLSIKQKVEQAYQQLIRTQI